MAARESDSKPVGGSQAGTSRGRPPPDAVARALAEVEQTLDRLKQVRAERAEAEQRFRTELEARDVRIAELEADREGVLGRVAEFEARLADAQTIETQRDEAVEKLDALERRLGEFEAALDTERVRREVVEAKLAETEGSATAEAERFRGQLLEAEQRERDLADARDSERRESEEVARQLREQVEAAARAAQERAGELEAAMRARLDALDAERGEATGRAAELEVRLGEAEAASAAANARLAELESLLAERAGEAEEAARNDAILSGKVAEQEAELSGVRAQLAQVLEELSGARSEIERRDRELAERGESADAETNGLRSEVEKLRAEAAELWNALESAEAVRAELTGALEAERGQVRELGEKLDLAADRLTELQLSIEERDRLIAQSGEVDETVALLTGQLNGLRSQLAEAERQRDEARRAGGDRGPTAGHWPDDRVESRRRRLRRYRELLRERQHQTASQQRVLAQRVGQCEEVLGRRRELVEARQIIERTHKKITSARAKSGAAAVVFFGLAVIAVLSGLSWAVVTRTFPATYAASAVLAADFTAEPAQPGDLEAWQAFHEELLLDPNVVARVSERMAQRGSAEFGQPAVLKAMLERDMTWSSPEDGKLAIEMRGLGREATARRLDTYVTTLAVEANALRQRRSEHSTTVVVEKARPGNEPLEDPRLQYAGIGLAGGSVFCLLLWFGIWKRMVHTKSAFEHAGEIDNLLEDARWVDPIQQIMDAREPKPGTKAA